MERNEPGFDREKLKRLVEAGRASGEPVDGEAAFSRLRAKYAEISMAPRRSLYHQ